MTEIICHCPLCVPDNRQKAEALAQDVLSTKRTNYEDQINVFGYLMAAAALAKSYDIDITEFEKSASRCYLSVEPVNQEQLQ